MRRTYVAVCAVICLAALLSPLVTGAARKPVYVTVAAGAFDRRETPVSFALPKELKAKSYGLRDERGRVLPLQTDAARRATFVLPELKAGATTKYRLEETKQGPASATQGVQVLGEGDRLKINAAGRQVIGYEERGELPRADINPLFRRGGYIYPVYTPSGRLVTDHYPPKHLHQQSVWFAWTKTEFEGRHPDFWNMGDGTGKVEFVALDETWGGPVHGGFKSRQRFIDLSAPSPKTVLNEVWEVTVYGGGQGSKPYVMFDLVSTQECAASSPLVLPEYHYGGIGVRGHRDWDGKENAFFLTSEGKGRDDGNATRARWCHLGGRVDGQLAGIAILGHPDNFRAPQPIRLHPTEPYLCFAPSQMGRWEIAPGRPYVSRYRYVVTDGPPDAAEIERLWNDYATPPQVTVTTR